MPTYEYKCDKCGEEFELVRSMKEDVSSTECPSCSYKAEKVFSPPGLIFKGKGFYSVDKHNRDLKDPNINKKARQQDAKRYG